jgi:hypothetical protein
MSLAIHELDSVVLLHDRPADGLAAGDVGAVVHVHPGGERVEVEFVNWSGETVAVATLPVVELRPLNETERMQSRAAVAS